MRKQSVPGSMDTGAPTGRAREQPPTRSSIVPLRGGSAAVQPASRTQLDPQVDPRLGHALGKVQVHRDVQAALPSAGAGAPRPSLTGGMRVSRPADGSELEADRLADRVMRMPAGDSAAIDPSALRPRDDENGRKETAFRREAPGTALEAPPGHHRPGAPSAMNAGGAPLDRASRTFFEPRFGVNLAHVRVHSDSAARDSARSVGARAYALGSDIVFGSGEYRPHDAGGRHLLAHELAHVVLHGGQAAQGGERVVHRRGDPQSSSGLLAPDASQPVAGAGTDTASKSDPKVVTEAELRRQGIYLLPPDGAPIVGRSYQLRIAHPPEMAAKDSLSNYDFTAWFVRPPGKQKFGYRSRLGPSAEWTLDQVGTWTFAAEIPMSNQRVGLLLHVVEVVEPGAVAMEKLNSIKGSNEAAFLIGLEMQNLANVNNAIADQKTGDTFITLSGSNPATTSGAAPNLPVNVYTAHAPVDRPAAKYQWAAIPSDPGLLETEDRFGKHPREIEGRLAFDLGTGPSAQWTIFWDAGYVDIFCWMRDERDQLVGLASYRQVVLTGDESKKAKQFQDYMAEAHTALRSLEPETSVFVPSVHLATETGQSAELSFFLGRAAGGGGGELMLVDVTPGVPRREYRGANFEAVLKDFNTGNAYPVGQIVLRVPQNTLGVAVQDWRIMTEGATVARRLSTGWGWASLGLAGLGVLAAAIPGGQPFAPVFFMASATAGAASAAASLYDRYWEARPSSMSVAIDIAQLAGSLLGMAGAANVLRHGTRIAAATRTGQFVLYAGFSTDLFGGVLLAAESAAQIADILDSKMPTDEKVSTVVRILSSMLVTGALLAWSAKSLDETASSVRKVLGEEGAGKLGKSDLWALSILDEQALKGLAGASQEEVQRIAAVIREDPVRAAALLERHGGSEFLSAAKSPQADLEGVSTKLEMQRRAALLGYAATKLDTVMTKEAAQQLSRKLGVTVTVDVDLAPRRIEIDYKLGSWLSDTDISIKAGAAASVGDVLIHGIAMESIQEYRVLSGGFKETYTRARAWLGGGKMPRAKELMLELDKYAMHHEARLARLRGLEISPELERQLLDDMTTLEETMVGFRAQLVEAGAPTGVIAVDLSKFGEYVSQGDLQRMLDRPGSGFARYRHSTSGNLITEPGFRDRRPIDMGRSQKRYAGADVTYPDIYGTEAARGGGEVALEIKSPRPGETVASHFRKTYVAMSIIEQHGGRIKHLPTSAEYFLVVDLRACKQTPQDALNDLSRVLRNYAGQGDARGFWNGVRFIEGSWHRPTLSTPYAIP